MSNNYLPPNSRLPSHLSSRRENNHIIPWTAQAEEAKPPKSPRKSRHRVILHDQDRDEMELPRSLRSSSRDSRSRSNGRNIQLRTTEGGRDLESRRRSNSKSRCPKSNHSLESRIAQPKSHSEGYAPRYSRSVSRDSRSLSNIASRSVRSKSSSRQFVQSQPASGKNEPQRANYGRDVDPGSLPSTWPHRHSDGYAPRRSRSVSVSRDKRSNEAASSARNNDQRSRSNSCNKSTTRNRSPCPAPKASKLNSDEYEPRRSRITRRDSQSIKSTSSHLKPRPPRTESKYVPRGTSISSRDSRSNRSECHVRSSTISSRGSSRSKDSQSNGSDDFQENKAHKPKTRRESQRIQVDESIPPDEGEDCVYDVKLFVKPPNPGLHPALASAPAFFDPFASFPSPAKETKRESIAEDEQRLCPSSEDSEEYTDTTSQTGTTRTVGTETIIRNFLGPSDNNLNKLESEEDISRLRLFAGRLSADWGDTNLLPPDVARRIRDFQYAQEKRRKKYGDERPWGILGLYDHLSGIRVDVEWAEDAAWRRLNGQPYLSWADFEDSKKKGTNRPFFTYFVLVVCTILLLVSIAVNGWSVEQIEENPMIGPSAYTLIRMGAKDTYLIVNEQETWRLISSITLHAGIIHYFINMLALWFVGTAIEMNHGSVATMIVFIIPAVGGTILSAIFLPQYITVGASGGIFGLIGACLSDIIVNWKLLFSDHVTENGRKHNHIMVIVFLLLDIVLNSIVGLTPYVDNFTHLGGMLFGFLCGISTMERLSTLFFGMDDGCLGQTKHLIVRFFGLIVSVITLAVALIILLEGDGETNPCPSCTWLSCVPFPPWAGETDKWWYCDNCGTVTADIVTTPNLYLSMSCPDGTTLPIPLDSESTPSRSNLENQLPTYCREYCLDINV